MLNPKDREAIEGLFFRLDDVERQSPPRDQDAEALIASALRGQPAAPYYMAQTILVQESALKLAEQKIAELEGRLGQPGQQPARRRGPWERDDTADRGYGGGGGFLAGAAQTAMGVAGGVLLGSAIASMFGAGAAQASEWGGATESGADAAAETDAPLEPDSGADTLDTGGDDSGGGDFGGGGDFDFGGDF